MSGSLKCQFYRRLLIPHLHGTLHFYAPWLWIRLNAHLCACESCQAALDDLQITHAALTDTVGRYETLRITPEQSIARRVHAELDMLDAMRGTRQRLFLRVAVWGVCVAALLIFAIVTVGKHALTSYKGHDPASIAVASFQVDPDGNSTGPLVSSTPFFNFVRSSETKQPNNKPIQSSVLR